MLLLAAPPAGAQTTLTDYDADDDRLIEVRNLAQLDAIRHDLNGNGDATHADYIAAFPDRDTDSDTRMGCPAQMACQGYELMADLDFDENGDGNVDADDHNGAYHDGGSGWQSIGSSGSPFTARFNGNGHTISNLFINRLVTNVGFFGVVGSGGVVEFLGLPGANVSGGNEYIGILVGRNYGIVQGSYTTGRVRGGEHIGGLIGRLDQAGCRVRASYSTAAVNGYGLGSTHAGGLIGSGWACLITASYATGPVTITGANAGGLAGGYYASGGITASYALGATRGGSPTGGVLGLRNGAPGVTDSYYDRRRTGQSDTGKGDPKTTAQLRNPTGYENIYANWNVDVDGDGDPDNPWDFGGPRDYPLLRVDFNRDGDATWEEFGNQYRYIPTPPPYNPAHDHPEIYANPRHQMATSCEVRTTGTGDDAVSTSTLTFDLGDYTRPLTLALSLWDGTHFRSLQSQGINMPELRQEGQTATVEVVTDPAQTRFRLDSEYGLNLVLGYADCHTDDPE